MIDIWQNYNFDPDEETSNIGLTDKSEILVHYFVLYVLKALIRLWRASLKVSFVLLQPDSMETGTKQYHS